MYRWIVISLMAGVVLGGCSPSTAKTPCPNFGMFCSKTPINHWQK